MDCNVCGHLNASHLTFCEDCGNRLKPVKSEAQRPAPEEHGAAICPSCHTSNPPLYRFCVTCGAPLPATSPPPPAHLTAAPAAAFDVAHPTTSRTEYIECERCHGLCAIGTRFCKHCGGLLIEAELSHNADPTLANAGAPPAAPLRMPSLSGATEGSVPPSANTVGRLVVIVEDGSEGKSFPLSEGQFDIGRTEGQIRLVDDPYVSPRHARVRISSGRCQLRDMGSTNGIFSRIRKPYPLLDGDLLLIGLEVLQFQIVTDAERALGPASQHGTLLFGSPAKPAHARLLQRSVEGVVRDVYHLVRDETILGRETGDIVFTSDPFLSRRHAAIRFERATGQFNLVDLESSNGTFVAIRQQVDLTHGDFVRIGQHLLRVDLNST